MKTPWMNARTTKSPWICLLGLVLVLAGAACTAPPMREASAPEEASAQLLGSNSLDPSDVIARSKLEGCQLIPYDSLRDTCVSQNEGLHAVTACGSAACQRSAGHDANITRRNAWQSCVDRRTLINDAFASTLTRISAFKRGPAYKGWRQDAKVALATLVGKIEEGEPGHKEALRNARDTLATCKSMT